MKLWILLTLICTTHVSIAATCSASESSGSLDGLLAFATNSLSVSSELLIPEIDKKRICLKTDMAKRAGKNSYKMYKDQLKIALDKNKIPYTNIEKYLSDNLDQIKCKNRDTIKLREYNSIFKHALDSRNYNLIENALFVEIDGERICNPNVDFEKAETINGKDETLLDFVNKLLEDEGMSSFHDFPTVKTIKIRLTGCKTN